MPGINLFRFLVCLLASHTVYSLPSLPRYTLPNEDSLTSHSSVINSEVKNIENELLYEILMNELIDKLEDSFPSKVLLKDLEDKDENLENDQSELDSIIDEMSIEELLSKLEAEGIPLDPTQNLTKEQKIEIATWGDDSTMIPNAIKEIPSEYVDNVCSIDTPCADDQYCYETSYASECLPCLAEGSLCVDDAQCCFNELSPTKCIRGACQSGVLPGTVGSICESQAQCLEGLCCAMVKGYPRRICKPLTTQGQQCTPLVYFQSLEARVLTEQDHYCPCEQDLVCAEIEHPKNMLTPQTPFMVCKEFQDEGFDSYSDPMKLQETNQIVKVLEALKRDPQSNWPQNGELESDQRFLNQGPSEGKTSKKSLEEDGRIAM